MKKHTFVLAVLNIGALAFGASAAGVVWKGAEGLKPWAHKSHHVENVRIEGGNLCFDVTGNDPQITTPLPQPLKPTASHVITIRAKSKLGGRGEVFWVPAGAKDASQKTMAFIHFRGGDVWRTYRIRPMWGDVASIDRLRIDWVDRLPGNRAEIAEIRIDEAEPLPATDASAADGVVFALATPGQEYLSVNWASDAISEPAAFRFTTMPDGRSHAYWFDLKQAKRNVRVGELMWKGRITGLVVKNRLSGEEKEKIGLSFVKGVPNLPPDPVITSARPNEAIPRAGRPFGVELIVRNLGTKPVRNIRFSFEGLPENLKPLNAAELSPAGEIAASRGIETCGDDFSANGLPNERRFIVRFGDPGKATDVRARVTLSADGCAPVTAAVAAKILPSLGLKACDYPSEPKPVSTGRFQVGAFLFPGWDKHMWNPVWSRAPWRKPVLGWYDETTVEVTDWQIKHLVENGISWVAVDWYWGRGGGRYHSHWEKNFARARYRKYLKWALMWCNEVKNRIHFEEDQACITKYWIDHFFADPQYLRIDGKPVVILWSAHAMERDLGPGGTRKLLDLSQRIAREAGYEGIYFVVQRGDGEDPAFYRQLADWGYSSSCTYKYTGVWTPRLPPPQDGFMDYGEIVKASPGHWRALRKASPIPFWPSLSTGWDDRPWRGDRGWAVTNITVAGFAQICREARKFGEETGVTRFLMGPLDEWGEGSIGYPNAELGFGMLEAVREAFGEGPKESWPLNHAPEDVGCSVKQSQAGLGAP